MVVDADIKRDGGRCRLEREARKLGRVYREAICHANYVKSIKSVAHSSSSHTCFSRSSRKVVSMS